MAVVIDDTSFQAGMKRLDKRMKQVANDAVSDVATEVLRLSQKEVPHDTGQLQNTGHTKKHADMDYMVGYNKVYAARLHEHPEFRFQKGRKGKYLEDPIKKNLSVFRTYFEKAIKNL